jgi:hypothetical protein
MKDCLFAFIVLEMRLQDWRLLNQASSLTMRCSEPLAAPRSSISMITIPYSQPRALQPAVVDLVSR